MDALTAALDTSAALNPAESSEGRRRRLAEMTARLGQADFRQRLMAACDSRCVVTGCDAEAATEAAHIDSYEGRTSNWAGNGLLLRADLHSLFDRGVIWIDDCCALHVHPGIGHYAKMRGSSSCLRRTRRICRTAPPYGDTASGI
ncbi:MULTISPECIES: HNH endonuclease [unclassified Micromonospora]|uniref:HNH endonuclease n=1 Tax=unclassified Micromonospora TaxID=2617518 RepID=UPI002FF21BB1